MHSQQCDPSYEDGALLLSHSSMKMELGEDSETPYSVLQGRLLTVQTTQL